jgi:hypothetical protein
MRAALHKNGRVGGRMTTDGVDQGGSVTFLKMFLEDSKFFWTEYHLGKVNIILHLVSFLFLSCGLAAPTASLPLLPLRLLPGGANHFPGGSCTC